MSVIQPKIIGKNSNSKRRFYSLTIILLCCLIIGVTAQIVLSLRSAQLKRNEQTSESHRNSNSTYSINILGLITVDTVNNRQSICENYSSIEDCVLIRNAIVLMNTLARLDVRNKSVNDSEVSRSSSAGCNTIQIRRSQLPDIFDPQTHRTLYQLSGIPLPLPRPLSEKETRSQIDARSLRIRWTSPINYFISRTTNMTDTMINNIRIAISIWQLNTCLIFNELPEITRTTNRSYMLFSRVTDDNHCSSPIGYDRNAPTSRISLGIRCSSIISTIMHEIGHSLGYIHTQSRIDRNSFISVLFNNIEPQNAHNFFLWQFGTIQFTDVVLPYDFGSIMHYHSYGFSRNGNATIVPLDVRYERTLGHYDLPSFYDYKSINCLYCSRPDCPQMFVNNYCQNNGYLDRTCTRCICPEGFGGLFCEQRDTTSNCGDTIINPNPSVRMEVTIQNPIANSMDHTHYCTYHIRSQFPGIIRFRLDSISTIQLRACRWNSMIEVRHQRDVANTGPRWCGNTVPISWTNITAETNFMLIIFRGAAFFNTSAGMRSASFRATITFDPEPVLPVSILNTVTTTKTTTTTTSTTVTTTTASTPTILSTCPPPSFRCAYASQPNCGGCLNFQPCRSDVTQECTIFTTIPQLISCNLIINGVSQCQYTFLQVPTTTTCQRTVLTCCPKYRLITFQGQYFCVYNAEATDHPTRYECSGTYIKKKDLEWLELKSRTNDH